jgi:hypothetical protein
MTFTGTPPQYRHLHLFIYTRAISTIKKEPRRDGTFSYTLTIRCMRYNLPNTAKRVRVRSVIAAVVPVVVKAGNNGVAEGAVVNVAALHGVAGAAGGVARSDGLGAEAGVALIHEDGAGVHAGEDTAAAAGSAGVGGGIASARAGAGAGGSAGVAEGLNLE